MASPAVDVSHGITIVFGTSGFSGEITDVTPPGTTRDTIDTSHQGTSDFMTFIPSALADNGELTFTVHYNPDTEPPMTESDVAETITITAPSGATWAFSGFMSGYEPDAPHLDKMTASVTVKVSGAITVTPAS